MTYKEAFLQCDSIEEIMEMANTDMAFAAVINSDRIPVIMRALKSNAEVNHHAAVMMMAADLIESLTAQLAEKDAEIKRLNDEPPAYKFYYCESEDSYLLGHRVGNFYYAHWHDGIGFVFDMSRFLPWGEHVVAPYTAWKEHTYPSEPKKIDSSEWFKGFLAQQLAASQRRADAAVEDLYRIAACDACKHYDPDENACAKPMVESYKCFEWRGPDEKGETHE